MTSVSLGASLARQGKKVLIVDADSQHSATVNLGVAEPDKLAVSLATIMQRIILEQEIDPVEGIISQDEGISLTPSNNVLAGMEIALAPIIGRETVLRQYIGRVRKAERAKLTAERKQLNREYYILKDEINEAFCRLSHRRQNENPARLVYHGKP